MSFKVPEKFRVRDGVFASSEESGNNGAFLIHITRDSYIIVIASDGEGWEHVSVSFPARMPTWDEMCLVKSLFWSEEDCVVQYLPPKSEYVNNHKFFLHLWRKIGYEYPLPPSIMVEVK